MKGVKKVILYIVILVLPLAGLYYTIPQKMERQYTGVEYRLGEEADEKVMMISVDGKLQKRFFNFDRFRGTLHLGEEQLNDIDVVLHPDGSMLMGVSSETGKREQYGVLYADETLEQFTVAVLEKVVLFGQESDERFWNIDRGLMISAPADHRQKAVAVSNERMSHLLEEPLK